MPQTQLERKIERKIGWGILGCGDVTEVKSGPAFRQARGSDLTAVMRRDGVKAQDYAQRHNVARWYDDADDLVNDPNVDAIYIATPTAAHFENVLCAAKTGKPILVEKPMGLSEAQCREMIAACEASGSQLFPAFYRRALPRFDRLRHIVHSGEIGAPRFVSVRHFMPADAMPADHWKLDPAVNGGGQFVDMQIHTLDWLDHAFGPAKSICGTASNQSHLTAAEDTVSASLEFASGVVANFSCCYAAGHSEEVVTIQCDKGSASMSFFAPTPIRIETSSGSQLIEVPEPQPVHLPLVQQIVDHLHGGPAPSFTAQSGLRASIAVDKILHNFRAG